MLFWLPAAVLYGLLILAVAGATALCFYMRFGRSASLAVALAWLLTMVVMLGGVGGWGRMGQVHSYQMTCLALCLRLVC